MKTKTQLFTLRLSYSGKAVHRAFPTQGQEAFLEGHVYAFDQLGGVPTVHIRYDNLQVARCRGCCSGATGTSRSGGWRSGRTSGSTRSTANPASTAPTRRAVSKVKAAGSAATTASRCRSSTRSASSTAARRGRRQGRPPPHRQPGSDGRARLPRRGAAAAAVADAEFPTWLTLEPRVDRYARVTVRQCQYSVPARLIGRRVRVRLGACTVTVFDAGARSRGTSGSLFAASSR